MGDGGREGGAFQAHREVKLVAFLFNEHTEW